MLKYNIKPKTFFLFCLCLYFISGVSITSYAQNTKKDANKSESFIDKMKANGHLGASLQVGLRPLNAKSGEKWLYFVDESPSADDFLTKVDINGYFNFGVNLGLNYDFNNNWSIYLNADLIPGNVSAIFIEPGFGYRWKLKNGMVLRAKWDISMGWSQADIGSITNNSLYIQINGKQFFDPKLDVSLRDFGFGNKPSLALLKQIGDRWNIFATVGFRFFLGNSFRVRFSSPQDASSYADVELGQRNIYFGSFDRLGNNYVVKEKYDKAPYNYTGVFFGLGITYAIF